MIGHWQQVMLPYSTVSATTTKHVTEALQSWDYMLYMICDNSNTCPSVIYHYGYSWVTHYITPQSNNITEWYKKHITPTLATPHIRLNGPSEYAVY